MDKERWINAARSTFYHSLSDLYNKEYWGTGGTVLFSLRDTMFREEIGAVLEAETLRLMEEYKILSRYKHTINRKYHVVTVAIPKKEYKDGED